MHTQVPEVNRLWGRRGRPPAALRHDGLAHGRVRIHGVLQLVTGAVSGARVCVCVCVCVLSCIHVCMHRVLYVYM